MPWTDAQLEVLGGAGEIDVAPARGDGSVGPPTAIWIVGVDGDLYVRSYRGASGGWFRGVRRTSRGRVSVGTTGYDVRFEPAPGVDRAAIDAAYRSKYGRSSYVDAMVTDIAAATTLRLTPVTDDQETP
jgi:hypothetical protein